MKKVKENQAVYAVAEFTYENALTFKNILECIESIVDEVVMKIGYDGVKIRQMDPARVAMVDYFIGKEAFEEWMVHTEGIVCFNVPEALKQVFKRVSKDTKVKVFIDGKDEKITFRLTDTRTRERTLHILETMEEEVPAPKIRFGVQIKLMVAEFINDLEDLKESFDVAEFIADSDQLTLRGVSDVSTFQNKYRRGGDILIDHRVTEESKATYSLGYLTDFALSKKILKLCDVVNLNWATNMPLRVELQAVIPATFIHWLAPRIEVE